MAYAHIAVGVDDAPGAAAVVDAAARLRATGPGRLTVVHVLGPLSSPTRMGEGVSWMPARGDVRSEVRAMVEAAAASTGHPGAEGLLLEAGGPVAHVLCDWAAHAGVDLLVVGAHRGRLERLLTGGVAGHLVHHAPCAVLMVPPGPPD